MNCKLPSKTRQTIFQCKKEVTTRLSSLLSVELIQSRVTNRQFQYNQNKQYQNLEDYIIQNVEKQRKLSSNDLQDQSGHNDSFINQLDILDQLQGLNDDQLSSVSKQEKVSQQFQAFKTSQNRQMRQTILKDRAKAKQWYPIQKKQIMRVQKSERTFQLNKQSKINQKYERFQQLEKQRQLKQKNNREKTKNQDFLTRKQRRNDQMASNVYQSNVFSRNMATTNDFQNYRSSFESKQSMVNTKMLGFHQARKTSKYERSGIQHKFQNFNIANRIENQPLESIKNRFAKKSYFEQFKKQERDFAWPNSKQSNGSQYLHKKQALNAMKQLKSETLITRNKKRESFLNRPQNSSKSPQQGKIISGLTALNLNSTIEPKQHQIVLINEIFNKSLILKMKNYIQSKLPNCKQCFLPMNTINKQLDLECSICSDKTNSLKIPLTGILFQIENFKKTDQTEKSSQCKNSHSSDSAFSSCEQIVRQVQRQIQRLQQFLLKLKKLKYQMENIQNIKNSLSEEMSRSKEQLFKILKNDCNSPIKKIDDQYQQSVEFVNKIKQIIPLKYLQEINLWTKIKPEQFSSLPKTEELLNIQMPYFLRTPTPALLPILQTLTNNFQSLCNEQEKALQLSISTPVQLPNLSLGNVRLLVDGTYSIPQFQHIRKLWLQFNGKRTYRQLSSLIQKIPDSVEQIVCLKYDHRIHSHPSGQNFPLLSKLSAIRSCKKLSIQIVNIKDQKADLQQMSRILSKKKQLKVILKKSLFSAKINQTEDSQIQHCERLMHEHQIGGPSQDDFGIVSNIIKRVGKGIIKLHLDLPINLTKESRQRLYNNLILSGNYKLYELKIVSQEKQKGEDVVNCQNHRRRDGWNSQQILNRMLNRKKLIIFMLSRHKNKGTLIEKVVKEAVCGIIIGQ